MPKKNISHICDYCGKEHFIDKGTYNKLLSGKNKNSYCSINCKSKAQENKKEVVCTNCGKHFMRKASHIKRHLDQFCSTECQYDFFHKQRTEFRICEMCSNKFIVSKSSKQRFCSIECQGKWQSTITGECNSRFYQKKVKCECCGKYFYIKQYKVNNGQHHFCSNICRQKWFADVWSQTNECREISRNVMIGLLESGKMSNVDTKPQKIVDALLNDMNIKYEREYDITYYSVDNYLSSYNLMIEVNGDYWHSNPNKFKDSLTEQQYRRISKDKAKHTYIKNNLGIEVLYLWENDIYRNIELCKKLIDLYTKMNGMLINYHSFNYYIDNNAKLCLKENLIIPYQDMKPEQYKYLYKHVS